MNEIDFEPEEQGFVAKASGYFPVDPSSPHYEMEGGRVGASEWAGQPVDPEPLYTLDQFRRKEAPYVSVAMDNSGVVPYGQLLESPDMPGVIFKVHDTGIAFNGKAVKEENRKRYGGPKGLSRVDIARDNQRGANDPETNKPLRFVPIQQPPPEAETEIQFEPEEAAPVDTEIAFEPEETTADTSSAEGFQHDPLNVVPDPRFENEPDPANPQVPVSQGTRLKNVIMDPVWKASESVMGGVTGAMDVVDPSGALGGVGRGVVHLAEGVTSPLGIATLGILPGLSTMGKTIVGGLFSAPMIKAAPEQLLAAKNAETIGEATENLTVAAGGLAMASGMVGGTPRGAGLKERAAAEKLKPQFDYETGVIRTTEGVAKVTPEGIRPLTPTEATSLQSLSKKVEPIKSDLVAERERLITEGRDVNHPEVKELDDLIRLAEQPEIPTAAEVEATVEAPVEPAAPKPRASIVGPALRTAESVREGKLGDTHAELKVGAAQEGLDFTEGEHVFKDAEGNTLSRAEAWQAAKENGQLTEEGLRKAERSATPELDSQDLIVDLPNAARKLKLEEVGPDTYERIEDEALLDDHVAYKDPDTNQMFQIPKDATQADLVEILGAVRGEEAAVRKRAELERRTEEVTSRGADEPPTVELPTSKPSGKYAPEFKPPDRARTEAPKPPESEPVTTGDYQLWNSPERLQEWLTRESASGALGKKGSPFPPAPKQIAAKRAVEARIAELQQARKAAKTELARSEPIVEQDAPVLTDARWHGDSTMSVSFDATGRVPTSVELEAMFKAQGHKVSVRQLKTNITGAAQGKVKFSINALEDTPTGNVRDSKKAAQAAFEKMFGGADPISEKSALQRAGSLAERFTAAWQHGAEQSGLGSGPKMTLRSKEAGSTTLPDILIDAGRTFYRKGMEFVEWSKQVVKSLGEKVKPHLEAIWKKINQGPFLKQAAEIGAVGTGNKFSKVQQSLDASVSKAQVITDRLVEKAKTLGASEMAKQVRIADRWMAADYHRARKELLEFSKDLPLKERAKFTAAITDALKRVPVLTKDPAVIFRRAQKVKDRITEAVYEVQRKEVIGKIERMFEKNEETKSITVREKQAIRARENAFQLLKDKMPLDLLEAMQKRLEVIRQRGKDLFILDEVMKEQQVQATLREITTQGVRMIDTPEQARLALGETETWFQRQIEQIGRAPQLLKHFNLALTPFDWLVQTFDKKAGGAIRRTMKLPVDVLYGEWMDSVEAPKRELATIAKKHNLKAGNFDRIYAHAELRQPGGRENLEALGYTPRELARVRRFRNLSKGEQEWLKKADQINNDLFPKVQQVLENYFHQEIEKVDGYFPRQRDWDKYNALSIEGGRFSYGHNKTSPEKGHTISRTGAITRNKTNAQEIMFKHIDDALYHIKLGPEIRRLADVVKKKEFAENVGTMGQKVFSDWVDVLSRNGQQGSGKVAILDFFRKNVGMAALAFRLTTTALQPLSLIQGMAVVSPKNMGRALTMMGSKANREFILNNFPEIRQRVGDDPAYSYTGPSIRDTLARAGFKGISMLDRFAAMTTGLGAYLDHLESAGVKFDPRMARMESVQAAQLAVRKTQSSSYPKDLPLALSRGNFTGNLSVDKAIFQFQNFLISKWALTKNGALQLGIEEKSAKAGARIFTFIALGVIAEELTREGIKRAISATIGATERQKQQDKKDKKAGKTLALKMAEKAAVDMITSVPLVSNAAGMIQYEGSGVPVLDAVGKTLVSGAKATTAAKRSTRIKEAINAGQGAGALLGIPTGQALDLVKQGVDANKSAIDPSKQRW